MGVCAGGANGVSAGSSRVRLRHHRWKLHYFCAAKYVAVDGIVEMYIDFKGTLSPYAGMYHLQYSVKESHTSGTGIGDFTHNDYRSINIADMLFAVLRFNVTLWDSLRGSCLRMCSLFLICVLKLQWIKYEDICLWKWKWKQGSPNQRYINFTSPFIMSF